VLTNISFLVAITKRQVRKESARVADLDLAGLDHGPFGVPDAIQRHIRTVGNIRPLAVHQGQRILEFLSALTADLVRPFLDREHAAHLAVMTPQDKLENS
jgi:hypothetical protein